MEPTLDPVDPPARAGQAGAAPAAAVSRASLDGVIEQFAQDYVRERRADRRWRIFFRLSWLLIVGFMVVAVFSQGTAKAPPGISHTALVEVNGEIAAGAEANAEVVVAGLRQAFEDEGARAVVIRINSPGGSPVQSGIINDEIRRLKAKHDKKVYAVVDETCASGAYYVAVAADEIFVDKASLVGSIGVLIDGFGFTEAMEKLGVERRLLTAGEHKGILDPFSPLSDQHRAFAQATLDQIHQQFIKVVKEGRGERLKETPEMFSGLFWNGEEAVKLGLADRLGNLDFVAREVVKAEEVIDYTQRESLPERLAKRLGSAIGEGAVRSLHSLSRLR